MSSLYLRNVPDDVATRLQALAAREGMSLEAFAMRELADAARRADNAALCGTLPDVDIAAASVVNAIRAGRAAR